MCSRRPLRAGAGPRALRSAALLFAALSCGCIDSPVETDPPPPGGGGGSAPPDTSTLLSTVGIVSAAAGDQSAQVVWEAQEATDAPVAVALFQSASEATLYQGPPILTATGSGRHVVGGLTNGQDVYFGLAMDTGGTFEPIGAPVALRPSAFLFYVDASSTCGFACSGGPGDPFPDVLTAALVASSFGGTAGPGANVWVREGTYVDVAVPLHAGVHLYGGFDAAFDLATRDPQLRPTVLVAQATGKKPIVELLDGKPGSTLDGFVLDGGGTASAGVDLDNSPGRLASLSIRDCAGRGIRLRSVATTVAYDVLVQRCSVRACGAEGLNAVGAYDLVVEGSLFSINDLEGLDLDDLVAPDGVSSSLHVRDSVFFGNGAEGLDCDLGPPPIAGGGSDFEVCIEGSLFERNGWKPGQPEPGLIVDIDFEGFPGWRADVLVRGCTARANRGGGVELDLDATASCFVHRLLSTANARDGLRVSSESATGLAVVSASALVGNRLAGVRALGGATAGNVPVALVHCVLAGNAQAGLVSASVESIATSSAAWLQPAPWGGAGGVRPHFVALGNDPALPLFVKAPIGYATVLAVGNGELTLDDASALALNDLVELADDGVPRLIDALPAPDVVGVTPFPASLEVPALLARFAVGGGVQEDYQLAPGSAATSAGMPAPVGPAPNAGIWGAPFGGAPGREGALLPELFRVAATQPASVTKLKDDDALRVAFEGGELDSLSIPTNVRVRDATNALVTLDNAPFLDVGTLELVVPPPSGKWPQGKLTLELHAGLTSVDGAPLATPLALPFRVQ